MDHPPASPVFPRGDLVFDRPDLSRSCVFYEINCILRRDNTRLHFEPRDQTGFVGGTTVIVPVDEFNVSCLLADDADDDDDENDSSNGFEREYGYVLYEKLAHDVIAGQVWKGELVERVTYYKDGTTHYDWKQTPTEKLVAIKLIESHRAWERENDTCSERPIQEIAAMQYLEKRIAQMDEHDQGEVFVDPISIEDTWNRHMRIIRNYHVMTPLDMLSCAKNMYIIMPYCDGGELLQLLNDRDRAFEEEEARNILKQLLKGLETLQKVEICHRDISIENIMTIGNNVALFIDFGVAIRIPYTWDSAGRRYRCLINSGGRLFGKTNYLAPEYVGNYDGHAIDLWALGVVLYMMVLRTYLWENPMETDVAFNLISSRGFAAVYDHLKNRNEMPRISSDLVDLIQNLFWKEPSHRFSLEQVMAHRWLLGPFFRKQHNDKGIYSIDSNSM